MYFNFKSAQRKLTWDINTFPLRIGGWRGGGVARSWFVLGEGGAVPHEEGFLRDPGEISQTGQEPVLGDDREAPLQGCQVLLALGLGADQVGAAQGLLDGVVLLGEDVLRELNSKKVQSR